MIIYISATMNSTVPSSFILFANFTLSLTGFVNALIYFFQRNIRTERNSLLGNRDQTFHDSFESIEGSLKRGLHASASG